MYKTGRELIEGVACMTKTLLVYWSLIVHICTNTMSSDAFNNREVEGDHHQGEDIVSISMYDVGEGGSSLCHDDGIEFVMEIVNGAQELKKINWVNNQIESIASTAISIPAK